MQLQVISNVILIQFIYNTIHRVNAYIKNGWDKELVDPDNQLKPAATVPQLVVPTDGWQDLTQVYRSTSQVFGFTNAQEISYFVTRTADDGLPMGDFKSVNNSASSLFRCGTFSKFR